MIKINNLKKIYNKRVVLDIEKFVFEQGKKYAIMGSNGSGKSTLLKIIAKQEKSTNGKVLLPKKLNLAYMPQSNFAFSLSVKQNLLVALSWAKQYSHRGKAIRLLKDIGLYGLRKKNATTLSGGETQKIALCRTFMKSHDMYLLDEPTSAMDIQSSLLAENVIEQNLNNKLLIFATHSLKQAERFADIIIFMDKGKIVEFGTNEILKNPKSETLKQFLNENTLTKN